METAAERADSAPVPVRRGVTRRQALAAALATGVGVGAVRMLGASMQRLSQPQAASGSDWISPLGSESARVMHLLRRTTFGYTEAQLEAALSALYDKCAPRSADVLPVRRPQPAFNP